MTGACVVLVLRGRKGGEGLKHNPGVGNSDRCYCKRAWVKAPETGRLI